MNRRDRDRRVQRTRGAIVESFNGLVLERPYDDIHVADIIGDAGVGRSTFYEHFRNKDELLRHSVSVVLSALADAVTGDGDRARIQLVLEHFLHNRRAARALLNEPSAAQVARRHAELIEARLAAMCREHGSAPIIPLRLGAAWAAGAQLALIRAWLDGLEPCTPGVLAAAIQQATRNGVTAMLTSGT